MDAGNYILLINRDENFLKTVSKSLVDADYPTLTAKTRGHAFELISDHRVVLIICDSELSDSSGYDFLGFVKSSPDLKKIPFVFLVSARFVVDSLEEEVEKILRAFDMGATDFIVDTLDEDISKVLIKRINKILPSTIIKKSISASDDDRRDSKRLMPRQMVNIDLSRDGLLWMPGQVTNINEQGLLMKTSLLGKLDMLLYIRVQLPGEKSIVVASQIRHITISKESPSAEIGVEIKDSIEWIEAYNYIAKLMGIVKQNSAAERLPLDQNMGKNTIPDADQHNKRYIYIDPHLYDRNDADSGASLETKLYRSLIGKQLGNYKAVSFIGAGSMAGVFKGRDVVLERDVALKVISYKLSTIPSYRDMFVKEARLVSRLGHPNVAQIYHIDHIDDVLYSVMELISGGTLMDMIKDRNQLNLAKSLEYLITTCRTLDFVGKQNIVHRNIKPTNIMINDRGMLKITDFGVATADDEANQKRNADGFGSPLYASPEYIIGRPLDCLSDMYSLGATFYHVFAGVPPFEGDSFEAITNKHLNEHLVPLKKKNPMVSVDLSDIIGQMMAKKPRERFDNYRALINELIEVVH